MVLVGVPFSCWEFESAHYNQHISHFPSPLGHVHIVYHKMCNWTIWSVLRILLFTHIAFLQHSVHSGRHERGHQTAWRRLRTSPLVPWSWPCTHLKAKHNSEAGKAKYLVLLLHKPFWGPSWVSFVAPRFIQTAFSWGDALSWAVTIEDRVVRGSQSSATSNGPM